MPTNLEDALIKMYNKKFIDTNKSYNSKIDYSKIVFLDKLDFAKVLSNEFGVEVC